MGLKLKIVPSADVSVMYNVLDASNGYVNIPRDVSSDIAYDKKITFNLWLDNSIYSTGFQKAYITQMYGPEEGEPVNVDVLSVQMDGSLIHVCGEYSWGGPRYAIGEDYNNQILDIEINKSKKNIESFLINDSPQTKIDDASINTFTTGVWRVGGLWSANLAIWNLKIYDTSAAGELIHEWKGYPGGNLDSAWEDQIGSLDGQVQNITEPSTRNIYGDEPAPTSGRVLSIVPQVINYNVLDFAGSDYVSVSSFSTNGTTMDISLNMYIDEDIGSGGPYTLWAFSNHANHQFEAFINTGRLYLSHDFSGSGEKFYVDLTAENMLGRIMDIKVHRTSGDVYSLTVDGVSKSLTEGTQTAGGWSTGSHFGAREGSSRFLTKATMWNIYLSADAAESFWYGYPDGNTNGAWLDQISSKNGTVSGSPDTRNIQDSTQGSGSKLLIAPNPPDWTNLISWWKMTETSGGVAADSHGTDDATIVSGTQTSDGIVFNGFSDYLSCNGYTHGTDDFTFIIILTPVTTATSNTNIFVGATNSLQLRLEDNITPFVSKTAGNSSGHTDINLTLSTTSMLAVVRSGDNYRFFIDGTFETEVFSSSQDFTEPWQFIGAVDGGSFEFKGTMRDFCYFTDAKSDAYITAFYNSGSYTNYEDGNPI